MELMESTATIKQEKKKLKNDHKELNPEGEAIILYPSLGAPLLTQPDQPLRLYMLFESALFSLFIDELKFNPKTPETIKVINKSLKIFPWAKAKQSKKDKLFSDGVAMSNIRCTFIRLMSDLAIEDENGELFGYIRKKTNDYYANHEKGFRYLFLVEVHNLGLSDGVYDCGWKLHDKEDVTISMKPPLPFPERQDLITMDFLKQGERDQQFIKQQTGFKIEADKYHAEDENSKGKIFDFDKDDELPLCNHHVIYVTKKSKLNIAQLTDIHVSSRQLALKISEAQVLPGMKPEISPKIGEMVNVSFETFKDLLDQMGESDSGIDMLALTGDFIDFNKNFDPTTAEGEWQEAFKRPAKLWGWMDPSKFETEEDGRPAYPYYVDMVTIYSLLHYFITQHKKPIVMLNGNHEAYDLPYGISPRLYQFRIDGKTINGKPLNEGIPADHNLTVYEATLLYGSKYNNWRRVHNFEARYLEWFYMMFNPLSDFSITYGKKGAEQQSFTALSWDDSEQFLTNFGGGTLPRANEAVSDNQLKLLEASSKRGKERILLTHFTFVSYGYNHQINESGEVNYNNQTDIVLSKFSLMSHYEEGSFILNRRPVYEMLYEGKFTHVFSGHSHRAGLYTMEGEDGFFSRNLKVQGHLIEDKEITLSKGGKAKFIVGASAGPIPGQNYYGDLKIKGLANWSLDCPSGNILKFGDSAGSLNLKYTKNSKAKPRFAVALSYFNTDSGGVFHKFESGENEDEFNVVLHPDLPDKQFIKELKIYNYLDSWESFSMSISRNGPRKFMTEIDNKKSARELVVRKKQDDSKPRNFLSVGFNNVLGGKIGYKQYSYDSPWIFPVRLVNKQEEAFTQAAYANAAFGIGGSVVYRNDMEKAQKVSGFRFELDENVPDFQWYRKSFLDYKTDAPAARTRVSDESYP